MTHTHHAGMGRCAQCEGRTSRTLNVVAVGVPAPQGSKRHVGGGRMIESSRHVKPWRESIRAAALAEMGEEWTPLTGPVVVDLTFLMPRPKGHHGTGRNAQRLRPSAPTSHTTKPDLDKLIRAVLDALTSAGVWLDDSQVCGIAAVKEYADGLTPRLAAQITEAAVAP